MRRDLVGRAMRLIADGTVDREGVTGLASRLGYSTRQLERHLVAEVGAGPLALARAQRAQTARLLIETTDLPVHGRGVRLGVLEHPTVQRHGPAPSSTPRRPRSVTGPGVAVRRRRRACSRFACPFRTPFSPESLFGHLAATAIPGCEEVRNGTYRRTLRLPAGISVVGLTPTPDHVVCQLALDDLRDLSTAIARCRRLLDLDADPEAVDRDAGRRTGADPEVAKSPGRRIPGDRRRDRTGRAHRPRATGLARRGRHPRGAAGGRPARHSGERRREGDLTHVFPTVEELAEIDPTMLGLPGTRRRCIVALVDALASGRVEIGPGADWDRARRQLGAIAGIGTLDRRDDRHAGPR